jgi:2,4-dienoyl-CoA reductase-like NADH-dependent reductase (Old Yellow Enzyme family)
VEAVATFPFAVGARGVPRHSLCCPDGPRALTPDETAETAKALEAEGIDAIEVDAGFVERRHLITRSGMDPPEKEGYNFSGAMVIRWAVRVPLMLVGSLRSRQVMERVRSGDALPVALPALRPPTRPG